MSRNERLTWQTLTAEDLNQVKSLKPHMHQREQGLINEAPIQGQRLPMSMDHSSSVNAFEQSHTGTSGAQTDIHLLDRRSMKGHKKPGPDATSPTPLVVPRREGESARLPHVATQLVPPFQPVQSQLTRTYSNRLRIPVLPTLQEWSGGQDRYGKYNHVHDGGWECAQYHMREFTDPSPGSEPPDPIESYRTRGDNTITGDETKAHPPTASSRARALFERDSGPSFISRKADPSPSSLYGTIRPESALPTPRPEYQYPSSRDGPTQDIPREPPRGRARDGPTQDKPREPRQGRARDGPAQDNPREPPRGRARERDVSRGRQLIRDVSRFSTHFDATPSDMMRPHPAFYNSNNNNTTRNDNSHVLRALGQTKRGPRLPPSRRRGSPSSLEAQPSSIFPKDHDIEGGRYAWYIAWSGFFVTFSTWGLNTAFGIFQAYYATILLPSSSLTNLAWIGSIQIFLMFFLGTPIGALLDRGYFRLFFNGGSLLLVLSLFGTSWCTRWWHFFLVQGILTGLGMGLVFPSAAIMLMSWFAPRQMGRAMMLGALGAPVGSIVYVAAFRALILRVSFATTYRILAGIATLTLIPPNIIARPRRNGLRAPRRETALASLKDGPYLAMAAGFFFAFWGLYVTVYYLPLYSITQLRTPGSRASDLLLILSATNVLGRLLPGVMSDACTGPLNLVIPATVLCGLTAFSWIPADSTGGLIVVAALYGFFSAALQALYTPALHAMTVHEPATMGVKSGFVFTVIGVACLTGAPLAGALVDQDGVVGRVARGGVGGEDAYLGAQLFSGGCMIVAAGLLVWARWLRVGWKGGRF